MENKKENTNNSDPLKKKLDDPQHSRVGRDFKSADWNKQSKLKLSEPKKDKQKRQTFRTFVPVFETIEECIEISGEIQNEWIVRAILDRIEIDYPEQYEKLKARRDEFPEIRSDAKPGIDFLYEQQ